MEVYAFVGPSGTGKSYRAAWVARQNGIDAIIDDGLLIRGNKLEAGYSAKKEATRVGSIKRALFRSDTHAAQVRSAIERLRPERIMIIGTSDGMAAEIARRLELPPISHYIRIEDVATQKEIEHARTVRKTQGKHVIPVPTFEIKKDFSGVLLDTLHIFNRSKRGSDTYATTRSVVRPTFSYLGSYSIADNVITSVAHYEAGRIAGVSRVLGVSARSSTQGVRLHIDLEAAAGQNVRETARCVQRAVFDAVEDFTALNVIAVDVLIKSLALRPSQTSVSDTKKPE